MIKKKEKLSIYMDYMATTPMDDRVKNEMIYYIKQNDYFGNSSSDSHIYSWKAKNIIEKNRKKVAKVINALDKEIIFTSGATESNNLAIKGITEFYKIKKNQHIISSSIEHKSVLNVLEYLEKYKDISVSYIKPDKYGIINIKDILLNIQKNTILISIGHVNNEIGTIQNIQEIGKIAKHYGILFHVDISQSFGKIDINMKKNNINFASISSHKIYGPKGIGALYINNIQEIGLIPLFHGGDQEHKIRPGTLPTYQIIGFGKACEISLKERVDNTQHTFYLKKKLWNGIKKNKNIKINGSIDQSISNNLNILFNYKNSELIIKMLSDKISFSQGSACSTFNIEPSHVLKAIGLNDQQCYSSIRLSFGNNTQEKDIDSIINMINNTIQKIKDL